VDYCSQAFEAVHDLYDGILSDQGYKTEPLQQHLDMSPIVPSKTAWSGHLPCTS